MRRIAPGLALNGPHSWIRANRDPCRAPDEALADAGLRCLLAAAEVSGTTGKHPYRMQDDLAQQTYIVTAGRHSMRDPVREQPAMEACPCWIPHMERAAPTQP